MEEIRARVRAFAEKYQMLEPGGAVILGLSGGMDSVCLLLLLKELCGEWGVKLAAVHVHHGLRGAEADRDEAFCRDFCAQQGVALRVRRFDVAARAREEGLTVEEAGRLCRYEAFQEEAARLGREVFGEDWAEAADEAGESAEENGGAGRNAPRVRIAVAHHRDDQAETVLFNLFRGSGIRGLCGMEPVHGDIIRPLLCLERREIRQWLLQEGQTAWCEDSTNACLDYSRNRIRGEILRTAQEELNAQAVRHVADAADELREIERFLEQKTGEAFRLGVRMEDGGCFLFEKVYQKLDPLIQRRLLRRCMAETGGLKDVERVHIGQLADLMEKQVGRKLDLPGFRQARREYQGLRIVQAAAADRAEDDAPETVEVPLPPPEQPFAAGGYLWRFTVEPAEKNQIIPEKMYTKVFDYDKIKRCLEIRGRLPGDYLEINQAHGRKTLKEYLRDEKIPASERASLSLLADGSHIVWIPGHRISEGYKVTEETRRILKVQIL